MQMSCYLHINLGTQRSRLSVWTSAHSQLQGILSPTSADGASPPLGFACRYLPQKTWPVILRSFVSLKCSIELSSNQLT